MAKRDREIDPHQAIDFMLIHAREYAQAKANRIYLEEFRKSLKSTLYSESPPGTIPEREAYAYSHPDYIALLEGLKDAVAMEEELRWKLISAQARIDVFRTQEASNRALDRITQ